MNKKLRILTAVISGNTLILKLETGNWKIALVTTDLQVPVSGSKIRDNTNMPRLTGHRVHITDGYYPKTITVDSVIKTSRRPFTKAPGGVQLFD